MKSQPNHYTQKLLTTVGLVCAAAHGGLVQEKPYTQPPLVQPPPTAPAVKGPEPAPGTLNSFFNGKLPDAIGKAKINLNARLRYEFADQDGLDTSHAPTIRTRFGITTAPLYGFQGMLEAEDIHVIGSEGNYNAAGSNPSGAGKTVIADPPTTELNQAWLSYSRWDSTAKAGRQRIALDNHRFVGDVGWRQNMQTFDSLTFENRSLTNLNIFYGYVWDMRRVFGDVDGLPAANQDFCSDSHLFNVSYNGWKYGKVVAYSYLLDLENDAATSVNNSTATYGMSLAGSVPVRGKVKLDYRAEFAWQQDYADSLQDYDAEYYNLELGVNVKPFVVGAGYEVLGTDSNDNGAGGVGFKTPLATLHAFNGWADVFLNTPARGLRDLYAFAQVTLPGEVPLRFIYHKYEADSDGADFGHEFNVVASKKFGKYWTALAKYAHYEADDVAFADVDKVWLQIEFNF